MMRLATIALALGLAAPAAAHDLGFAGLLDNRNTEELEPINLSTGAIESAGPYELKSGTNYKIVISSDGTGEMAISGAGFFRAIWVNEVVINDLEVRPMGISSFEFDDAGEIEMSFIAIVPGTYELRIPGTSGDTQRAVFNIR